MTELKKLWDRVEKRAIYAVLILFVILQLIAIFVPSISSVLDRRGEIMLVGLILVFVFRYLDEKLSVLDEQMLKTSSSFSSGLRSILIESKEYNNIDLIAHTSIIYSREILRAKLG